MTQLEALEDVKEQFLKDNPHLMLFQQKIDVMLRDRTAYQRCELLQKAMFEKRYELGRKFKELIEETTKLEKNLKELHNDNKIG